MSYNAVFLTFFKHSLQSLVICQETFRVRLYRHPEEETAQRDTADFWWSNLV